ncbi:hypothetical protein VTK56DRAFT_8891 [Thermocarpiscus australiensis]
MSHVINALAILTMLVVILFQVTGLPGYCYRRSSMLNAPLFGGYVDFKPAGFYCDHINVMQYWAGAAVVGGAVPTIAFVVTLF